MLIKSPKQSGETYCFCSVSYYHSSSSFSSSSTLHFFFLFFFQAKFCLTQISVTTGQIVLKFGNMGRYGFEVVQEGFKAQNVGL